MKTIRAVALLVLLAAFVSGADRDILAFYPDPWFDQCPDGCTCTVGHGYENWKDVTIECENDSPADVCDEAWESSYTYCFTDLPNWIEDFVWSETQQQVDAQCWIVDFDGCDPLGLDPPATISLECECVIWY
jgi:hypothetical protein